MEKIKYSIAEVVANQILDIINPLCEKTRVVGSLRRKAKEVHDIDILIMLKEAIPVTEINTLLESHGVEIIKSGDKLIQGKVQYIPFDIYIADSDTWETLSLIRTGPKEHNIFLATAAKSRGWKLKASGEGLVNAEGKIIDNTEEGILGWLCGSYKEPRDRK